MDVWHYAAIKQQTEKLNWVFSRNRPSTIRN